MKMQNHATYQPPINPCQAENSQCGFQIESQTTTRSAQSPIGYNDPKRKLYTDADFDSEFDEDVDEDFTDEECQFSFENFVQKKTQTTETQNAGTGKLLAFLELVNSDIQKYFGRNKGSEDSCDVYQDKWTSGKSGRELYYADLMKIAQGIDTDDPKSPSKSECALKELKNAGKQNTEAYAGKLDLSRGLGPLEGLFENTLKAGGTASGKKGTGGKHIQNHGKRPKKGQSDESNVKRTKVLPMTERKLPSSFWSEPKSEREDQPEHGENTNDCSQGMVPVVNNDKNENIITHSGPRCPKKSSVSQLGGIEALTHQPSAPPDFGDLLDCWGDVTHLSSSCPPSGHQPHHTAAHRAPTLPPAAT